MIEFLTLFLGLVSGSQDVRVAVAGEVAAVELLLDGESVGRMSAAPWGLRVDLGDALLPHELAAVAFDAAGDEIGRAVQSLNRPRPPAEAGVVLERDAAGRVTAARLTWESLEGSLPLAVVATLDGEALAVPDPERIVLPPRDDSAFHHFHARLEFAGAVTAIAQASFGGGQAERVTSDLTALPVALRKKGRLPSGSELERWIRDRAEPVSVAGLERGPGKVVVVRGVGVQQALETMEGTLRRGVGAGVALQGSAGVGGVRDLRGGAVAGAGERQREALALGDDVGIHLLLPRAREARRRYLNLELFAASPEISPAQGGLYWALTQSVLMPGLAREQRLSDAVAIAGLHAATGGRRRAVLLIVGDELGDDSLYPAAMTRGFLRALDVPLYVWRVGGGSGTVPGWPEATEIADLQDLGRAARELERDLERQRIVWLHGSHDPVRLTLAAGAPVTRLTARGH